MRGTNRFLLAAVLGAMALGTAGCPAVGPTGPTPPPLVQATCDEPTTWCGAEAMQR